MDASRADGSTGGSADAAGGAAGGGGDALSAPEQRLIALASPKSWDFPSQPPADCPFPRSESIRGVRFTGRHATYGNADTWYPSWASDGNLYSPWTDGNVNGVTAFSGGSGANTGNATILGDDPLALEIKNVAVYASSPSPYIGRYPCGTLVRDGTWFYGTYSLNDSGAGLNYDTLGPLVGFRWSTDYGATWTQTPHTPSSPLFGEPAAYNGKVKMGSPHFVDFGKNMEHSPDGKAYLVGHGAHDPDPMPQPANLSWITGDEIYLGRVSPSVAAMNDAAQYEFFSGRDSGGKALWSNRLADAQPIAAWNNHMGCVTTTYDAPLGKYLMFVTDGGNTIGMYDTYILESDDVTGPWRLVHYLTQFGKEAYFVNLPTKFVSDDGRRAWLSYSANFAHGGDASYVSPPGSQYSMCLQELDLLSPSDVPPDAAADADPLAAANNVARSAKVTASSTYAGYAAAAVTDGVVSGYPADPTREWASNAETDGAWIRLEWSAAQAIDRIWLFDRPNSLDQVTSGRLSFDAGDPIDVMALPDDASQGVEVRFAPRTVTGVTFTVTATKATTVNIGISEMAVFGVEP
jgi:hypothetical protein